MEKYTINPGVTIRDVLFFAGTDVLKLADVSGGHPSNENLLDGFIGFVHGASKIVYNFADELITMCPDRRVRHLARHHGKMRVRRKNRKRAMMLSYVLIGGVGNENA